MPVSVDRRALHAALKELVKVASTKSALPILGNVLIQVNAGALRLTTTDITTRLTAELPAEGDHLATCIDAKLLTKVTKPEGRGDAGDVTFEADTDAVTVTVDGLATRLPAADPTQFPSRFLVEDWKLVGMCDSQELHGALSWVLPATSTDPTRKHLQSVYVSDDGALVATDGHRLHVAPSPISVDLPVILSYSAATTLSRILKASRDQAVVARQTTDKYDLIRVRAGCFELTTKLPDHQFPPWKQVVPDKGSQETAVIFDVVAVNKTLRRVVQLSERGNVKVTVNGVVTLAPWGVTLGEAEVIIPTLSNNHDVNKPDIELGLDGAYLLDGLPKGADTVEMSFGKQLDPVRLDLPDQRLAVIMPLRL